MRAAGKSVCVLLFLAVVTPSLVLAQSSKKGGAAASTSAASTAPSTSSSGSSASIESQKLAIEQLNILSGKIAHEICTRTSASSDPSTIVIFDQSSFANIQAYAGFVTNAKLLGAQYKALLTDAGMQSEITNTLRDRVAELNKIAGNCSDPRQKAAKEESTKLEEYSLVLSSIEPFSDATALLSAIATASNSESPSSLTIPDSALAVALTRSDRLQGGLRCLQAHDHLSSVIRQGLDF